MDSHSALSARGFPWRMIATTRLEFEAAILLALLSFAAYERLYLPSREHALQAEAREAALEQEVAALQDEVEELAVKKGALEAGDPVSVEEAIRQGLGWGRAGERLLANPAGQEER
ncbi:MAG: hypothetical protein V1918_08060 [Planctomycetota bacterium]